MLKKRLSAAHCYRLLRNRLRFPTTERLGEFQFTRGTLQRWHAEQTCS